MPFFSDYYIRTEKGVLEKESCDLGYKNYKCDTIQDGVVIVKKMPNQEKDRKNNDEDEDGSSLNSYYD